MVKKRLMGEGGMRNSETQQKWETVYVYVASLFSALLCLLLLRRHLASVDGFGADGYLILLLFGGIGALLFPSLSRVKIGGVLEMEQRVFKEVRKVETIVFRGEVVRDDNLTLHFIDKTGQRHVIPDEETARFLASSKGVIPVSTAYLDGYPLREPTRMESVLTCRILFFKPHIFALLDGRRYHIGNIDDLVDWGRLDEDLWDKVDEEELRRYPRGR
jgi:hypothetical protein